MKRTVDTGPARIAVGGGKGGVGKSVVAANLAVALADLGFRTVLVDADLGAANQHTLFGLDRPGETLQSFLDRDVGSLEEITRPTGISRLFLLPGMGAVPGAANIAYQQKQRILRHLRKLDTDVVLIDVGAGMSFNTLDFYALGDLHLVVTTPQLTAMQNAYCFMKAAFHRSLRQQLTNHRQKEAFAEASRRSETDRIRDLRERCRGLDPTLDPIFARAADGFTTRLVGNMLETPKQRGIVLALARMVHDFLDVEVPVGPYLPLSRAIHESVTRRRPFLLSQRGHEASQAIRELAESLMSENIAEIRARQLEPVAPDTPEPIPDETAAGALVGYLRSEDRVRVDYEAKVTLHGRSWNAKISDLSSRGALIEGELRAAPGDAIEVGFAALSEPLRGTIRHVGPSGRQFGVELHRSSFAAARAVIAGLA